MNTIEQTENSIVRNKLEIDKYVQSANGQMQYIYKALPYMLDLEKQMSIYTAYPKADVDTATMIYEYLADCFTYVPYLPKAVDAYTNAIKCACKSSDDTVKGEIRELVYKVAKYRNTIARDIHYTNNSALIANPTEKLYDTCTDIKELVKDIVSDSECTLYIKAACETACRALLAHSSEHTDEYLSVLFDMNETVLSNLSDSKDNDRFRQLYWSSKKVYLSKCGIKWESPQKLNPDIKFD